MLTLKSLSFVSAGRFVEKQTIDFTRLSSIVQVEGQNENTGGSSGAAKSTIFKVLDFLFGVKSGIGGILQSRLTEEKIDVVGEFDYDGVPLTIQRGKKFLINHNGEITTGNAKLTEEKLDKVLGMSRELFGKILHKRQKEGGFFLDMGPSDVHKFLTTCLSLDSEMAKVGVLDKEIERLSKLLDKLAIEQASADSGLAATLTNKGSLLEPTSSVDPASIPFLFSRYQEEKASLEKLEAEQKAQLGDLQKRKPEPKIEFFDRVEIVALEAQIRGVQAQVHSMEIQERDRQSKASAKLSDINANIYALKAQIKEGDRAEQDARAIVEQMNRIKQSICPTCEQSWVTDTAQAKLQELTAKALGYKTAMITGQKAKAVVLDLESQLSQAIEDTKSKPVDTFAFTQSLVDMNQKLAHLRKSESAHAELQAIQNKSVRDLFDQEVSALYAAHSAASKTLKTAVDAAQYSHDKAKRDVEYFEFTLKAYKNSLSKFAEQENFYKTQADKVAKSIQETKEHLELAEESKKIIKSYVASKFENALESIGDAATRIIRGIPNMSTATIQLEGLKETKEGKIKEEINAVISMDGEIGVPIKSLSGGERSSTDLSIDLAVIQFIEEQTGKGINLIILDEPFDGLDFESSSNALEALKMSNNGKIIFLVDHNPMLKEHIDSRITVIRSGSTSRVIQ